MARRRREYGQCREYQQCHRLAAEFVRFDNLDGFTGSYERELQGEATVTMTGPTYHITGAALGFNTAKQTELTAETFTIKVSC